jgi:hypothetical protein
MKSDDDFQELIDTVERQEHLAEEEVKRLEELARQLHEANSMPRTMSADGPTFRPLPTEESDYLVPWTFATWRRGAAIRRATVCTVTRPLGTSLRSVEAPAAPR